MKAAGFVLLIVGIVLSIYNSFKFFTKEKVVDLGVIEITKNQPHYYSWSPVLGLILIAVGCILVFKKAKI